MSIIAEIIAGIFEIGTWSVWEILTDDDNSERKADVYINGMHDALAGQGVALEVTTAARNEIECVIEDSTDVDLELSRRINAPLVKFIEHDGSQSGASIVLDAERHNFVFRNG